VQEVLIALHAKRHTWKAGTPVRPWVFAITRYKVADDNVREVIFVIHWRGGQHSELRIRKPKTGEHGCATADEPLALMRSMAGRWPDERIAASLNRMGLPTGLGKTWTAHRVAPVRRVRARLLRREPPAVWRPFGGSVDHRRSTRRNRAPEKARRQQGSAQRARLSALPAAGDRWSRLPLTAPARSSSAEARDQGRARRWLARWEKTRRVLPECCPAAAAVRQTSRYRAAMPQRGVRWPGCDDTAPA
jgi:hypothetical protein